MDWRERIGIDDKIHFGKPHIKNTRVPVSAVLELIEEGISFQEIQEDYYPEIVFEDIQACVHYAREIVESEEVMQQAS